MPFFLFAGFYSNLGTIPSWIGWIQYLSVNKKLLLFKINHNENFE
jgi:hypothetical protein